jgi:hypothetical protein
VINSSETRTIIIGDVHGCNQDLGELLKKIAPRSDDHLIFIGDLIDRGPDSTAVLRRVYEVSQHVHVDLILGNHEEKFLRYVGHIRHSSGNDREMTGTEEYPSLLSAMDERHIQMLEASYWLLNIPHLGLVVTHGGLLSRMDLTGIDRLRWGQEKTYPQSLRLLNKIRYVTLGGDFLPLGSETDTSVFWADRYDGRWGTAIFGHHPFLQDHPSVFPHAIGIDTGCVYGGWLTAIVFTEYGHAPFSISVPSTHRCR